MKKPFFCLVLFLYYKHYFSSYYFKKLLLKIPFVNEKINKINKSLLGSFDSSYRFIEKLPEESFNEIKLNMQINAMKTKNETKHLSGVIYNNDNEHSDKLLKIFKLFSKTNPLHADVFPKIRMMEVDIVKIVSHMFDGDINTSGNVTSGGTESILLACYTYRELCRKKYGITRPNIVAFTSVHPAFDKACHYFDIKLRKATTFNRLKWMVDWNTICVVGSAPTYSYGIIDPICDMADFCKKWNLFFHVDCCMGGFLLPFLDNNPVSFKNKGITSISADTHKYGNCFKGSSVLLYSCREIKENQHYVKSDWEGGMYATPTMLGSKSGALIATTWASLLYMGKNEYVRIAKHIQGMLQKIKNHYKNNEYIKVIGDPNTNIIAFTSDKHSIYHIANKMKDWHLSILANPPAFHLCITASHTDSIINTFISDLDKTINETLTSSEKLDGTLAIYGSATKIENSLFVNDVVSNYLSLLSNDKI